MADFLAIPADDRWHEFVDGKIIERAMPVSEHGRAQGRLYAMLDTYDGPADPEGKDRRRGGWWFVVETEVDFPQLGRRFRPDITGWRCDRMPRPPKGVPSLRPDWVCEIVSPDRRTYDTVEKRTYYAEAGIPFYWLLDYERSTLTALKLAGNHYVVSAEAQRDDTVHLAPFDLAEIPVARLFPR